MARIIVVGLDSYHSALIAQQLEGDRHSVAIVPSTAGDADLYSRIFQPPILICPWYVAARQARAMAATGNPAGATPTILVIGDDSVTDLLEALHGLVMSPA